MDCCKRKKFFAPVVTHVAVTSSARKSINQNKRPITFDQALTTIAHMDQAMTAFGSSEGTFYTFNWASCRITEVAKLESAIRSIFCFNREAFVGLSNGEIHLIPSLASMEKVTPICVASLGSAVVAIGMAGTPGNAFLCAATKDCHLYVYRMSSARLSYSVGRGRVFSSLPRFSSVSKPNPDDAQIPSAKDTVDNMENSVTEEESSEYIDTDPSHVKPEWKLYKEYATPSCIANTTDHFFGYCTEDLSFYYFNALTQKQVYKIDDESHFVKVAHIYERTSKYNMAGIRSALLGYNGTASDGGHVRLVNLTTGESRIVYTSCYNGCKGVFGVLRYMIIVDSNSLVVCKIGVADATELYREPFAGGFIVLKSDFCINQLTETSASICATLLFNGGDYCRVTIEIDCEADTVSTEIFGSTLFV